MSGQSAKADSKVREHGSVSLSLLYGGRNKNTAVSGKALEAAVFCIL